MPTQETCASGSTSRHTHDALLPHEDRGKPMHHHVRTHARTHMCVSRDEQKTKTSREQTHALTHGPNTRESG